MTFKLTVQGVLIYATMAAYMMTLAFRLMRLRKSSWWIYGGLTYLRGVFPFPRDVRPAV